MLAAFGRSAHPRCGRCWIANGWRSAQQRRQHHL